MKNIEKFSLSRPSLENVIEFDKMDSKVDFLAKYIGFFNGKTF